MIQSVISDTIHEGQSKVGAQYTETQRGQAIAFGLLYGLGAIAHAIFQVAKAIEGDHAEE